MSLLYVRFSSPVSYRFCFYPIGSWSSSSRERNHTMLPFERYYSYKGVAQIYFVRISLQHSNYNAILEGEQCCHIIMLSKCENTTYLGTFDSITRKLAIVCNGYHMYKTSMELWCKFGTLTCVTRYFKDYHLNGT